MLEESWVKLTEDNVEQYVKENLLEWLCVLLRCNLKFIFHIRENLNKVDILKTADKIYVKQIREDKECDTITYEILQVTAPYVTLHYRIIKNDSNVFNCNITYTPVTKEIPFSELPQKYIDVISEDFPYYPFVDTTKYERK